MSVNNGGFHSRTPFYFCLSLGLCMNTGWELGRGKRAGEKDLVDTGGGGSAGWVMARVGNDRVGT